MSNDLVTASPTTLPVTAQHRALRAIEDVHLAYYGKHGIQATAEKLEKQVKSAAQHVYSLAVYASKQVSTADEAAVLFRDLCAFAEDEYKKQHGVENLRDALPTWATYKSNILRGVSKLGLDPADYRSERQFRIAVDAKKPKGSRISRAGPEIEVKDPEEIDEFLAQTPIRPSLQGILSILVFQAEAIQYGKTQDAASVLRDASDKLESLVDPDKLN